LWNLIRLSPSSWSLSESPLNIKDIVGSNLSSEVKIRKDSSAVGQSKVDERLSKVRKVAILNTVLIGKRVAEVEVLLG
jgi:hypothetical protein